MPRPQKNMNRSRKNRAKEDEKIKRQEQLELAEKLRAQFESELYHTMFVQGVETANLFKYFSVSGSVTDLANAAKLARLAGASHWLIHARLCEVPFFAERADVFWEDFYSWLDDTTGEEIEPPVVEEEDDDEEVEDAEDD